MPDKSWIAGSFPTHLIFCYHLPLLSGWSKERETVHLLNKKYASLTRSFTLINCSKSRQVLRTRKGLADCSTYISTFLHFLLNYLKKLEASLSFLLSLWNHSTLPFKEWVVDKKGTVRLLFSELRSFNSDKSSKITAPHLVRSGLGEREGNCTPTPLLLDLLPW